MDDKDIRNRIIHTRTFPKEVIYGTESYPIVERNLNDGELMRVCNPERPQQLNTYVFWDNTLSESEQKLVVSSVKELYEDIGFEKDNILCYGEWFSSGAYDSNNVLVPHESTKWVMQKAYNSKRRQLDAQVILNSMFFDPYQKSHPHWEILFTANDLYYGTANFWVGGAQPDLGTVISLNRFRDIKDNYLKKEVIKTEIFHEVGHVLGLPSTRRGVNNLENALGLHCKSSGCSMKQGMSVPSDWISTTISRVSDNKSRPYCDDCYEDLNKKINKT